MTNQIASELPKALVKLQGLLKNVKVDSKNPHFKNEYASLDTLLSEVRPLLTQCDLYLLQMPCSSDGKHFLSTTLMHSSGQFIETKMELILNKPDMQQYGSAITYARRYMIEAFLGITKTEDDDAQKAVAMPIKLTKSLTPDFPTKKLSSVVTEVFDLDKKEVFEPGDFVMPLKNSYFGQKLKDIPDEGLNKTINWCKAQHKPGVNVVTTQKFIEEYFRCKQ